VRQTQNANF